MQGSLHSAPQLYAQLVFDKGTRSISGEENHLQQIVLRQLMCTCGRTKLDPRLTPQSKMNSKGSSDLNVKTWRRGRQRRTCLMSKRFCSAVMEVFRYQVEVKVHNIMDVLNATELSTLQRLCDVTFTSINYLKNI